MNNTISNLDKIIRENVRIEHIRFSCTNTDNLSPYAIAHLLQELCSNYTKLETLMRIYILLYQGYDASQFTLATKPLPLFHDKSLLLYMRRQDEIDYNNEILTLGKNGVTPDAFFGKICQRQRPMVCLLDNGYLLPLIDIFSETSFEFISMENLTYLIIVVKGLVDVLIELLRQRKQWQRDELDFENTQIKASIRNITEIVRASKEFNDEIPDDTRNSLNTAIKQTLERQKRLNEKLGIRVDNVGK